MTLRCSILSAQRFILSRLGLEFPSSFLQYYNRINFMTFAITNDESEITPGRLRILKDMRSTRILEDLMRIQFLPPRALFLDCRSHGHKSTAPFVRRRLLSTLSSQTSLKLAATRHGERERRGIEKGKSQLSPIQGCAEMVKKAALRLCEGAATGRGCQDAVSCNPEPAFSQN